MRLSDLTDETIDELRELMHNDPKSFSDGGDSEIIDELADEAVPVYNKELLELAMDCFELATDVPSMGAARDGEENAVNIIAANVYEHIREALGSYFEEHEEDLNCEECPVCGFAMNSNPEKVSCCDNCNETYHIEHISLNGFCPLCKKKHYNR